MRLKNEKDKRYQAAYKKHTINTYVYLKIRFYKAGQ